MSVERRPSSTPESTGSAAFASTSSGKYIRVTARLRSPRANTLTVEMRSLIVPRAGLERGQLEAAAVRVSTAAEASGPAPDFDQRVRDGLAGAVEHTPDGSAHRRPARSRLGPRADVQERADRLRRRDRAQSSWPSSSNGVEREQRCRRRNRAPRRGSSSRDRTARSTARAPSGRGSSRRSGRRETAGRPGSTSASRAAARTRDRTMRSGCAPGARRSDGSATDRRRASPSRTGIAPRESVRQRPAPSKFGSSGESWRSTSCR